jgi:hypothetical protein
VTRYAITAAAAALAAGFLLQVQPFSGPHNISTPTVTPPSGLPLGNATAARTADQAPAVGANLPLVGGDANESGSGPIGARLTRRPDDNAQPISARNARLIVLTGLAILGAGGVDDRARLRERH